ncbi:MAG: 2-isopropylmalate synthase [Gammaproteobacteria bacterium]|nr:2-isopropylmalate synthase [Gammaproteobacteria bacterium]
MMNKSKLISIMDTTLRDGEQTPDISYTASEKLHVARMLLKDLNVDRIEIASARTSKGEFESSKRIADWAKNKDYIDRIEILGFCDHKLSADWLNNAGLKVLNLLAKGSELHCRRQLRMTPDQHLKSVHKTVDYANEIGLSVNIYLEDWSNGIKDNPNYVIDFVNQASKMNIKRILLADTLGILSPMKVSKYISFMVKEWPDMIFDFHGHNDYGLATANALAAITAGAKGIHTSVNGLGERAGNISLSEIVASINDHTNYSTSISEESLYKASNLVETFSGKNIAANTPILGSDVFTQTAGIHADGDAKGNLYETKLAPKRFGRERRYALGKLSGKASLDHNLAKLGINLSEKNKKIVLNRIIELGDRKHNVVPEDLLMIIADVLKTPSDQIIRIENYKIKISSNSIPEAYVSIKYKGKEFSASGKGDGGYDAFMTALKEATNHFKLYLPLLADYRVRIAPGGKTEALVETLIRWGSKDDESKSFVTVGVDSDQTAAAVIATEKMLNIIIHKSMID